MSTGWVKVHLSREQALSGEAAIQAACLPLFLTAGGPRDAALFADKGVVGKSGRALYLSPTMARLCSAVIASYNPVPTDPPKSEDVAVLISNGDALRLLNA